MSSSASPVSPRRSGTPPGSAIVVTLLFLAVITVLVVGMFSVMQPEQISANDSFGNVRATALCQMAADQAVALIRGATTTAEAAANPPGANGGEFWASQPGRITVFFNSTGLVDTANSVNLYSTSNVSPTDASTVDLNQPLFSGSYPIASPNSTTPLPSGTAMNMYAQWNYVLQDSTVAASASNQVIGRYAFWVDDELAKINVNTADGTLKSGTSSVSTGTSSFGFGTPTEVDLQALMTGGSTAISGSTAQLISTRSGANPYTSGAARPFNDPSEILQATGASTLYSDNNFNLTAYNRAPEMNIFGEPKIFIMPTAYGPSQNAAASQYLANLMLGAYDFNGTLPLYWNTHSLSYTNTYVSGSTPLASTGTTAAMVLAQPISQIYPSSGTNSLTFTSPKCNQLPIYSYLAASGTLTISGTAGLPQYFNYGYAGSDNALGMRIANYLEGLNSAGKSITWPAYPGASDPGTSGFAGKYTKRQIDSITQQILDTMDSGYFADNGSLETYFTYRNGFLSNQLICGASNVPRFNEIEITFKTTVGTTIVSGTTYTYPYLNMSIYLEAYLPLQYTSANSHDGGPIINGTYSGIRDIGWSFGTGGNQGSWLNYQDTPVWEYEQTVTNSNGTYVTGVEPAVIQSTGFAKGAGGGQSATGGGSPLNPTGTDFWQDSLLNITSVTDGTSAGFDLFGNDPALPDPDPRAVTYHPYNIETNANSAYFNKIMGTGGGAISGTTIAIPYSNDPVMGMPMMVGTATPWSPGQYHTVMTYHYNSAVYIPGRIGVAGPLKVSGGIAIWTHNSSGSGPWDVVPLDCLHGPINPPAYAATNEPVNTQPQIYPDIQSVNPYDNGNLCYNGTNADPTANPITNPTFLQQVLSAVIPINATVPVPGQVTVDMQVADPLVNKFPGDWQPATPTISPIPTTSTPYISTGTPSANTNFLATGGGDPSGFWFPPQYVNIPKVQRFPSTGYLQYIRTGMMPDPGPASLSGSAQHGTPFRMFNFAPSNSQSQQTSGGTSYPDWAMLDLFTVPAGYQPAYQLGAAVPNSVLFTWGGATSGRMNPNSALVSGTISPFSFARTVPLQALLRNLQVSNSYAGDGLTPVLSGTLPQSSIAAAINSYVAGLQDANSNPRPMMLPGEICNVPAVSTYLYSPSSTGATMASRNDLVRQIIGNLSTRSNTFTVWAVGQVIKKISSNTQYDRYQAGDVILGESRMKFLVERYVDYGVNGVPGNPYNPGSDNLAGTADDYIGTGPGTGNYFSPPMTYPLQYKYRVVSASQISAK